MNTELAIFGGKPIRTKPYPNWPRITNDIRNNIIYTLENDTWGIGSDTIEKFNDKFSKFHEARYCLSLHSGTSAIWVCLKALGINPGDEVIIPSYTFIATASAVVLANGVPVFADIDLKTGNIDPDSIKDLITEKTKAIIPVHVGGSPANMDSILKLSKDYSIPIIEDAAQAHGASWDDKKIGALGMGGIFSFQTSKNMSAGEGGAIISNDQSFMEACFSYHNCGRVQNGDWYEHHMLGSNLRMNALSAALLIPQISTLMEDFVIRQKNRNRLDKSLSQIDGIMPMETLKKSNSSNHIYMCRYQNKFFNGIKRDVFFKAMQAEGIFTYKGWSPLYNEPLFSFDIKQYPWLENIDYSSCNHINTERFAEEEAVWLRQNYLLGSASDTDDIFDAFEKVTDAMKKDPNRFLNLEL